MRAGTLRHRVTLQRRTDVQDQTTGAVSPTWTAIGNWRCEIRPIGVREGLIDGGVRDEADCRLVGRMNSITSTLDARDRAVRTDGLIYNFAGPPMRGNKNDEIQIRAKSGLNDG